MFSDYWRGEYPKANNLIRFEFYTHNMGKDLTWIGETVLLRFDNSEQKEYFLAKREAIIKKCIAHIKKDLESPESFLRNKKTLAQDLNIFNVILEITPKNNIDFKSVGYVEDCEEIPEPRMIH